LPDHDPKISIIIPARNESRRILHLLDSLAGQTLSPLEVIVVDDSSTDDTAAIAAQKGCRIVKAGELPEGWVGKSWACWQGASCASGDVLIFLDADTRLEEDGLEKIAAVFSTKGGAISVQPYHLIQKPYENFSAVFNIIVMMGTNLFTPLGNRLKARAFFGPCAVCSKEDYLRTGGHQRVKDSILDDIALGNLFRDSGVPVNCYGGKGTICFRMYPGGLLEVVEGWSKNFGTGAKSIGISSFLLISLWITGGFSSIYFLAQALATGFNTVPALIYYGLYSGQMFWMLRRIGNFSPFISIFYPVGFLFFLFVFIRSLFLTFFSRQVTWKGRKIST
jgi:4,4'-diaponeurosporenoate glycosyltransferase